MCWGRPGSTQHRGRALSAVLSVVALAAWGSSARASTLDASGHLAFASDAVLTEGFESLPDAQAAGASWITWDTAEVLLAATATSSSNWVSSGGAPGTVSLPDAVEGSHALKLTSDAEVAFALVLDASLSETVSSQRVQISFWGFSMGAEPELDVVYPSADEPLGPDAYGRVVAVRTGRETSDGWAEYSTGPIDGRLFGSAPLGAILLTARFATHGGTYALDDVDLDPSLNLDTIQDPTAYALADAIEVEPVAGSPMPVTPCTPATVANACGPLGECIFGHCVDGSAIWGAVPQAADHRADMVSRWAFIAEQLGGDRKATANASTVFSGAAVSAVAGATTPPGFYGGLNTLVNTLRDGHTGLGVSPSSATAFPEGLEPFDSYSDRLDLCFGLAQDDLPGAAGGPVYAVFWIAPNSAVGAALGATPLVPGDMLTQIDGVTPDAWLDAVGSRFRETLPNDPASEPAGRALLLASALGRYATTAVFSSCTAAGTCTTKTIQVASITYAQASGAGLRNATTESRLCAGRWTDSVTTWAPSNDESSADAPVFESVGNVATVEFDGFEAANDDTNPTDPYHAWVDPIRMALAGGQNVLFDARLGHGGNSVLGAYLVHQIRDESAPYFTLAVPRGTWGNPDPTWLFDPSLATCADGDWWVPDLCGWTGGQIDEPTLSSAPATGVKVAWINAADVSMNDIVPRDLLGAPNVRIFGPHPTMGAYGIISQIPPVGPGWLPGSVQTLDMRFGSSFTTAVAAPWQSGTGVPPDQIVLQKISDILASTDTVLTAARTWLAQ
jgi:hypothetical protein